MRQCYENQEESRSKGRQAAKYVQQNWSWEKAARSLIENIRAIKKMQNLG
jgi:hypothetical protein